MIMFDECERRRLLCLGGLSCSLQDDTPECLLGGEWNKPVYNKYTFTARLLGC